jgi:hypothetical protein
MHFEIPSDWVEIPEVVLQSAQSGWAENEAGAAITSTLSWQSAWAETEVTAQEVFSNSAPQDVVVWAYTRKLIPVEANSISAENIVNALQDVVVPVSASSDMDGLAVRLNQSTTFAGIPGIQQQISWDVGGVTQTIDVRIAWVSASNLIHVFIVRSEDGRRAEQSEVIGNILSSLRLGELHG